MSSPTVRVNSLFEKNITDAYHVDKISKIFFFLQLALGINRLPVCGNIKTIYLVLIIVYCLTILSLVLHGVYCMYHKHLLSLIFVVSATLQYVFIIVYNLFLRKQLKPFYEELNTFDRNAKRTFETFKKTSKNIMHMCVMITYVFVIFFLPYFVDNVETIALPFVPLVLTNNIELFFYGHLFTLLMHRLRYINYRLQPSAPDNSVVFSTTGPLISYDMDKLMNLYSIIVQAYDYLVEAIKWQLLVLLVTSFFNLLCCAYFMSLNCICGKCTWENLGVFLFQTFGIMVPLFSPCTFASQIYGDVLRLRELLTCRLYENRLDKGSRSITRALLSWTETRDLRFRLLRMFAVDIALPFKFVGLLITYLIILLQFDKVISP